MQNEKPARVKIGGLWQSETKTGIPFFSGDLSFNSRLEIWPNKKRDGKKDPDFNIYVVEKQQKNPSAVKAAIEDITDRPHEWPQLQIPSNDEVPF